VAPPPLPQLCASANGAALAPKASSIAGIKVFMFYLSRLKVLGRLSPPVTSVVAWQARRQEQGAGLPSPRVSC
jgi:hypothetical protein